MIPTLQLHLDNGTSTLGPFSIGSTLHECIAELQKNSRDYKHIKCIFNTDNTDDDDNIILDVHAYGIKLIFNGKDQRLKLIDVYDLSKVSICYHKQILQNNFACIYNIMGLTHPGVYDDKRKQYYVEYNGLWLAFLLDYDPGPSSLPVDLDDGTSPILNRLIVYFGKNIASATLPPLGPTSNPLYACYFEPIHVTLNEGIRLGLRNRKVSFGCSVQHVLTEVGAPNKIFYKQKAMNEDEHKNSDPMKRAKLGCDYFFNYIVLGMDILFDGNSHKITKFILHTNNVGHPDFNRWCKCNFIITLDNDPDCVITADSKWKDIVKCMGNNTDSPMMYSSSHGKIQNLDQNEKKMDIKKHDQSIKIYGYQSVLFEIMANESISTVTLFYEKNFKANNVKKSPMMMMTRAESILFEEEDDESIPKLPESSMNDEEINQHHSMINPSPMAVSITEATQSQLISKKVKTKKKRKKKKHKTQKPIEIDDVQTAEIENNDAYEPEPEPEPGAMPKDEIFDNIVL